MKPVTQNISFTAETLWNNTEYQISAITDSDLKTTFTIISPEKIRNYKLTFSGDIVYLYYLELENKMNISDLPANSPLRVIYKALETASKDDTTVNSKDDNFFIKYSIDNTEYRLFLGATGLPLEITDKSGEKIIIFKNASILN